MRDFTLTDIQALIDNNPKFTYDSFLDNRLRGYEKKFNVLHPYYSLFYYIAFELQPDFTVELGAWEGTAAACLASGQYESGLVVTIDHHTDPGDDLNEAKCCEVASQYPNLTYLKGWTWDVIDTVKSFNRTIDILFIDSWHRYDKAIKDWNLYSPLLSDNALIICDDLIFSDGPTISGMKRFWDELPGEKMLDNKSHIGYPMGWIKWQRN